MFNRKSLLLLFVVFPSCYSAAAFAQGGSKARESEKSSGVKYSERSSLVEAVKDLYPDAELRGIEHTWLYCDNSDPSVTTTKRYVFVVYTAVEGAGSVTGPGWKDIPPGTITPVFDSNRKMTSCWFVWMGPYGDLHSKLKIAAPGKYFYWAVIHWKNANDAIIETVEVPLP